MEPVIAKMYAEKTGKNLVKAPMLTKHPSISWMNASLDYLHEDDGEPVDCKNTTMTEGWGEEYTDQVPMHYHLQMVQQLEVSGANQAHLAVLFFGSQLRVYTIKKDDQLASYLIEIGNDFWRMVEAGTPPEPDWEHKATPNVMKRMYDRVEKRTIQLGDNTLSLVKQYFEAKEIASEYAKKEATLKAMLASQIGNAELAELPEGYRITRSKQYRAEKVVPAYEFIDLRICRPRKSTKAVKVAGIVVPQDFAESEEKEGSENV